MIIRIIPPGQFDFPGYAQHWQQVTLNGPSPPARALATAGAAPSPRSTPAGAYDGEGRGYGFFNDVWAFDLVENSWTELIATADVERNKRYGVAAVYDPECRDLVTFAGFTDQGCFDDTWRFDIENVARI